MPRQGRNQVTLRRPAAATNNQGPIRKLSLDKNATGADGFRRMIDNAKDGRELRYAMQLAKKSDGVDVAALQGRADVRKSQLRQRRR